MPRMFCACLVLLGAIPAASAAQRPANAPGFSLVLERVGSRWTATCEWGCEYQGTVSTTTRELSTPMRVDARGLRTLAADQPAAPSFAFTISAKGHGWEATAVTGTTWNRLSVDCAWEPCRSRVTDFGVSGVGTDAAQSQRPVDYDTFMQLDVQGRIRLFNEITPENRAELVQTQIRRWVAQNRARLTPEQLKIMDENLALVTPDSYRPPMTEEVRAKAKAQEARTASAFSREDIVQAMTLYATYIKK